MHEYYKYIFLLLLQLFTFCCYANSPTQVLILHSYSQEYPWTKSQHRAFIAELNSADPHDLTVSTEYLDTKRIDFDDDYALFFYDYLSVKYEDYMPDIIYVTDDNALTFAREYFHSLFPGVPVVFSGVNDLSLKETLDRNQFAGVFEKKDISRNLALLDIIQPHVKDILVVGDDSNTYKAIEKEFRKQLKKHPEIKATFVASNSIDDLLTEIDDNPSSYLFLTTLGAMLDSSGHNLSLDTISSLLTKAGDKVILSMEDNYVLNGVLGGYVTSAEQQGIAAAGLVADYLSGITIDKLSFISEGSNKYMFDSTVLKSTEISLPDNILSKATLTNKAQSFYLRHRSAILASIIGLATILILSLSFFLLLLSRKNREIRSTSIEAQELEEIIFDRTMQLSVEQRKLNQAQAIAHIGSYDWNIDDGRTTWSDELYAIVGHTPEDFKPTYEAYLACIHPADRDTFTQLTKTVKKNKTKYHAEYRIVRPDKDIRHVYEQGDVKFDSKGNLLGLIGVIQDITERKTSEKEHLRLQRELNQTYKMDALGQLTGGIAHDFNNILAIISGYTSLMLDSSEDLADPKQLRYIKNIDLAASRATDLVSKMMVFSRDDKGTNESLAFAPLIEDSIKMLRSIIPSSIDIDYSFADDLPNIMMDKTQLHQLLMNLVINAKDAMTGVGKIDIKLGWNYQLDKECNACHKQVAGDWISLSVSDTGCGISNEDLVRIFEPFYTTKAVGQGTGMGLSVLNAIVESHGGHILIDTEIGAGTTFNLLFPAAPSIEQQGSSAITGDVNTHKFADGQKILIVDDEPSITGFLSEMLDNNGYVSTVCNDSQEALSLVKKDPERFDLMITDQTMPQLLGSDLIQKIWVINPDMPMVLTTGYSDSMSREKAESLGINYMEKPLDVQLLQSKLAELLAESDTKKF